MKRNFLAFDIETAQQFPGDFSAWPKHRPLGICCGATVAGARLWHGRNDDGRPAAKMNAPEAGALATHLLEMAGQGYSIASWNGIAAESEQVSFQAGLEAADGDGVVAGSHAGLFVDFMGLG